jgi:hypothetical protein
MGWGAGKRAARGGGAAVKSTWVAAVRQFASRLRRRGASCYRVLLTREDESVEMRQRGGGEDLWRRATAPTRDHSFFCEKHSLLEVDDA